MIRNKPYAKFFRKMRHINRMIKINKLVIRECNKKMRENDAELERIKQSFGFTDADLEAFKKDAEAIRSDFKSVIGEF